jgi:hypothetical protein
MTFSFHPVFLFACLLDEKLRRRFTPIFFCEKLSGCLALDVHLIFMFNISVQHKELNAEVEVFIASSPAFR